MKKLINITFSLTLVFLTACSARVIVKSANGQLDPYPADLKAVKTTNQADALLSQQWAVQKIGLKDTKVGAKRVTVAILGTGIDYNHEDLRGQMKINTSEFKDVVVGSNKQENDIDDDGNGYVDDFLGYDFVENDGLPFDRNGAGTAMAGIIGAGQNNGLGIKGLMKDVSLVPVRFIDSSGHFLFPNLIKSLKYAMDTNVDVIVLHMPNYTFRVDPWAPAGTEPIEKQLLASILKELAQKSIPIVASAGNMAASQYANNSLMSEFVKFKNFVAVTSSSEADTKPFIANSGMSFVTTAAPGAEVMTTLPGNQYGKVTSTSVAAAHVGAAVAMGIASRFGEVSNERLLEALVKTEASDVVTDFQFKTIGGNRLNVGKYLGFVDSL